MCASPAVMDTAVRFSPRSTKSSGGAVRFSTSPYPSCPFELWPQHLTPPVEVMTHAWSAPAARVSIAVAGSTAASDKAAIVVKLARLRNLPPLLPPLLPLLMLPVLLRRDNDRDDDDDPGVAVSSGARVLIGMRNEFGVSRFPGRAGEFAMMKQIKRAV